MTCPTQQVWFSVILPQSEHVGLGKNTAVGPFFLSLEWKDLFEGRELKKKQRQAFLRIENTPRVLEDSHLNGTIKLPADQLPEFLMYNSTTTRCWLLLGLTPNQGLGLSWTQASCWPIKVWDSPVPVAPPGAVATASITAAIVEMRKERLTVTAK
eukprot:g47026.t1